MRKLMFALLSIFVLYLGGIGLLFFFQRALIYPAPKGPQPLPSGFEQVTLNTADGLGIKAARRAAMPGKPTILFFHGNGDSLPGAAVATEGLARAGYGLLLADYRGYADNPSKPTEAGLFLDGRAAVAFLEGKGLEPQSLIFMGASLGTGIATRMAAEQTPAALVLVSPFTRRPDVAAAAMPWAPARLLTLDRFDNISAIGEITAPVLVLHARDDKVIPFSQGKALAQAARQGMLLPFHGRGHQLQFTAPAQKATIDWLEARGL